MKEINQRRKELNISPEEWLSTWMLQKFKKRKRMNNFEYQALRNVVKEGGEDEIEKFEKIKERKVEGNRRGVAAVMYT